MPEKQLLWDITGVCNLHCKHCYAYDKYEWRNEDRIKRKDMTLEESKAFLQKMKAMDFHHVHLLGGEPLLRRDILDIIEYARSIDIKITMNSNGHFLTPKMIDSLIDLDVYQVAVSFEGTSAERHDRIRGEGSFEKSRRNLKALGDRVKERGAQMLVAVGYVMTKEGLDDVKNVFQFAMDNSANGMTIDFLSHDGQALENMDELDYSEDQAIDALEELLASASGNVPPDFLFQINTKPKLRQYLSERFGIPLAGEAFGDSCPAGDYTLLVENDGVVTPCGILNKFSQNEVAVREERYTPENINIGQFITLEELDQTKFFTTFKDFKKEHKGTVPTCQTCEFRSECQPCPVEYLHASEVTECIKAEERRTAWKQSIWNQKLHLLPEFDYSVLNLNEIGNHLIDLLGQGLTIDDLSKHISSEFGVLVDTASDDVWEFVLDLRKYRLVLVPDDLALERR